MNEYDFEHKVYSALGEKISIKGLLGRFSDPQFQEDGISRISDLHFKVKEPVRYRHDGELESMPGGEILDEDLIIALISPLLNDKKRTYILQSKTHVIDTGFYSENEGINFRVNLFYDRDGIACVIRMLPKHIPEIQEIGFMNNNVWSDLVGLSQGLVLVTGGTGSGKSTTISSLINYINNSRKLRIITLEDPIEYIFQSEQALISQRELGTHMVSLADGLRSALREDPDIIYVGEIRDAETAALALSASETGHLVFATLHTKDVTGTFGRFISMFPASRSTEIATQLSFSLSHIISQKLVPRLSGNGRIAVFEILKNVSGIGNMIRSEKLPQILGKIETGAMYGMNTLEQHLIARYNDEEISREVAVSYANDPTMEQRLDN